MAKSEFEKLSGLKKGKKIGSGVYGGVYEIVGKPKLVVKQQKVVYFRREVPLSIIMSRKKIIPKVHNVFQGNKYGYIVQERYDGTLANLMDRKVKNTPGVDKNGRPTAKTYKALQRVIKRMHSLGFLHMNLHANNVAPNHSFSIFGDRVGKACGQGQGLFAGRMHEPVVECTNPR